MTLGCPFYAHALMPLLTSPGYFAPLKWALFPNPDSNQCALITDAHSPCIMQIDGTEPDWAVCPRNPSVKAANKMSQGGE